MVCYLVNALEDQVRIVAIGRAQFLWEGSFSSLDTQLKRMRLVFGHDIYRRTIPKLIKVLDLLSCQNSWHNCALWVISGLNSLRAILFNQALSSPCGPDTNFYRKI